MLYDSKAAYYSFFLASPSGHGLSQAISLLQSSTLPWINRIWISSKCWLRFPRSIVFELGSKWLEQKIENRRDSNCGSLGRHPNVLALDHGDPLSVFFKHSRFGVKKSKHYNTICPVRYRLGLSQQWKFFKAPFLLDNELINWVFVFTLFVAVL